jgi:hypothetical protein
MKNWTIVFLMVLSCSLISGCSTFVPQNLTKSKSEYPADKKECEKKARSFVFYGQEDFTMIDEIQFTNECLKDKGWRYIKKDK